MKKLYSFSVILLAAVLLTACSKDILKPYDDRVEGTWELTDIDKIGFGHTNLSFDGGRFTFYGNGRMKYEDGYGGLYEGEWQIRNRNIPECYTDENGVTICDNRYVKTLQVNVVDFVTHDVRSEFFDEMVFTGTNRFKAFIYDGPRTYVYRFSRL